MLCIKISNDKERNVKKTAREKKKKDIVAVVSLLEP